MYLEAFLVFTSPLPIWAIWSWSRRFCFSLEFQRSRSRSHSERVLCERPAEARCKRHVDGPAEDASHRTDDDHVGSRRYLYVLLLQNCNPSMNPHQICENQLETHVFESTLNNDKFVLYCLKLGMRASIEWLFESRSLSARYRWEERDTLDHIRHSGETADLLYEVDSLQSWVLNTRIHSYSLFIL